jgi:hypothetical protein
VRESLRRPLLFLITVGTGSLIIILDANPEVVVAVTVLAGFLALLVTGALNLSELKPSNLRAAFRGWRRKKKPEAPNAVGAEPSPAAKGGRFSGMLGTFTASIRETIAHARASDSKKKEGIEKIDNMLDRAVEGADAGSSPAPAKPGGSVTDPLASLADLDLDSIADLDLNGEGPDLGGSFSPEDVSLLSAEDMDAVSEILKTHQTEIEVPAGVSGGSVLPPIAAEVPGIAGDEGIPDIGILRDELSALDDLDPAEIRIEVEGEEEEEEEEPAPEEEVPEVEEKKEDFDIVSFASGGTVEDSLITTLKADARRKKFVEDVSLLRELRGEKIAAKDLAAELEEILEALRSQR